MDNKHEVKVDNKSHNINLHVKYAHVGCLTLITDHVDVQLERDNYTSHASSNYVRNS